MFEAVLLPRAEVVNAERIAALEAYEQEAGEAMTAEGCIETFLAPALVRSSKGGPGWKNYFRLVALVNNSASGGGEIMAHYFDPVIEKLISMLRRVFPEAHDEDLYWCYHFVSGGLTLSLAETGRIDRLSGGKCRSGDMEAIHERMAPFMAAGFAEICRRRLARPEV